MIYLIGYRGSGKSTVGRLLADRMSQTFVDLDDLIEQRACRTIREIFACDGEAHFRDLETEALEEICRQSDLVVATGGGVVLREDNRRRMLATGKIIWLSASVRVMSERVTGDPTTRDRRPALTTSDNTEREIETILAQREPIYRRLAHQIVDTEGLRPESVVDQILCPEGRD